MAEAQISVIIVSWNVKECLRKCLQSLEKESSFYPLEIIVIDNASVDGSGAMVRQEFPQVKLVEQNYNSGFAAGCNLGVQNSKGEYLLFLNPDTQVNAGFFELLLRFWSQHQSAGVVGGKILNSDGSVQSSVRSWPSLWSSILDSLKILKRWPALAPGYLLPGFDYASEQVVDQVMGAVLATKRKVWDELKGFDEGFWIWFEEVDFCQRVKRASYEVWYSPFMTVNHIQGASFVQLPLLKRHRFFSKSLLLYVKRYLGWGPWLIIWFATKVWYPVAFIIDLVKYGKYN